MILKFQTVWRLPTSVASRLSGPFKKTAMLRILIPLKITVKNAHKTISVTGISIGGGNIQVTELNGFAVSLNMNTPTIIIVHQDIPGMIALVTEALSRYDINIAQMNVTREKAGEKAIMIIEVDSRNCDEAIEEIRKIPHLHKCQFL